MVDLHAIVDLLGVYAVHEGFPLQRHAAGQRLMEAGWTLTDLRALHGHVERTTAPHQTAAVFASLMADLKIAAERLIDIQRCDDLRAEKADPYPGAALWTKPKCESPDFARTVNRRIAYGRVVADRRPLDETAREMDLSIGEVERLVAEERADREASTAKPKSTINEPKHAAKVERMSAEERKRWFRDQLMQHRKP
jgi:hypothetical protein